MFAPNEKKIRVVQRIKNYGLSFKATVLDFRLLKLPCFGNRMYFFVQVRNSILLGHTTELHANHGFKQCTIPKSEYFRLQGILF
jgi:hypothetical protein